MATSTLREGIKLVGEKELKNLLRLLPDKVNKKANKAAVTAMSTPVMRAVRAAVPQKTGLLKKSIGRKIKTYKAAAVAVVGARRSVQAVVTTPRGVKKSVPANYFHLVEGGTKPHDIPGKNGQVFHHPGSPAHPTIRQAYQTTKAQATKAAGEKYAEVVESEARKLGGK
jgi:HK97 gp10 family phage protein